MMYTDGIHLISDTGMQELYEFGEKLGFKREWVHHTPGRPHFDLMTEEVLRKAIQAGAKRVGRREFVSALRRNPLYQQFKSNPRLDK